MREELFPEDDRNEAESHEKGTDYVSCHSSSHNDGWVFGREPVLQVSGRGVHSLRMYIFVCDGGGKIELLSDEVAISVKWYMSTNGPYPVK